MPALPISPSEPLSSSPPSSTPSHPDPRTAPDASFSWKDTLSIAFASCLPSSSATTSATPPHPTTSPSTSSTSSSAFAACLPCLRRVDSDDSLHLPSSSHHPPRRTIPPSSNPIRRALREDELQGLLSSTHSDNGSDSDGVSLHSNFGRGGPSARRRRRLAAQKAAAKQKKITLFGFDLFGSRSSAAPIHLPEDGDDALYGNNGEGSGDATSRAESLGGESFAFGTGVDSDAEPLSRSTIDLLSTPQFLAASSLSPDADARELVQDPNAQVDVGRDGVRDQHGDGEEEEMTGMGNSMRTERELEPRLPPGLSHSSSTSRTSKPPSYTSAPPTPTTPLTPGDSTNRYPRANPFAPPPSTSTEKIRSSASDSPLPSPHLPPTSSSSSHSQSTASHATPPTNTTSHPTTSKSSSKSSKKNPNETPAERDARRAARRQRKMLERLKEQGVLPEDKGGEEFEGFQGSGGLAHPVLPSSTQSKGQRKRSGTASVSTDTRTSATTSVSGVVGAGTGVAGRTRSTMSSPSGFEGSAFSFSPPLPPSRALPPSLHPSTAEEEFGDFVDVSKRDVPLAPAEEDEDVVDLDGGVYTGRSRRGAYRERGSQSRASGERVSEDGGRAGSARSSSLNRATLGGGGSAGSGRRGHGRTTSTSTGSSGGGSQQQAYAVGLRPSPLAQHSKPSYLRHGVESSVGGSQASSSSRRVGGGGSQTSGGGGSVPGTPVDFGFAPSPLAAHHSTAYTRGVGGSHASSSTPGTPVEVGFTDPLSPSLARGESENVERRETKTKKKSSVSVVGEGGKEGEVVSPSTVEMGVGFFDAED